MFANEFKDVPTLFCTFFHFPALLGTQPTDTASIKPKTSLSSQQFFQLGSTQRKTFAQTENKVRALDMTGYVKKSKEKLNTQNYNESAIWKRVTWRNRKFQLLALDTLGYVLLSG
jgi:hypothetical protein